MISKNNPTKLLETVHMRSIAPFPEMVSPADETDTGSEADNARTPGK